MEFEAVTTYLHDVTPRRAGVLAAMERYARRHRFPIIGPLVGRYLYQMAMVTRTRTVLELGSGFGYSAFWFALAVGKRGHITMTDGNEENRKRALHYFEQGGLETRFTYLVDDALRAAAALSGPYDILLNDIDKEEYPLTIEVAARLLRPGGLFITDNLLWDGRVMDGHDRSPGTVAIRRFTRALYADGRFFTTLLPLRDGIAVAVKRQMPRPGASARQKR
jgi:caffeoyl-CoA O-methyltransferase